MITTINDVATQLGVCRRSLYRLIRRINAEIVYMDNNGKKRLAAINADSLTMSNLREAKDNPRFRPVEAPKVPEYTGNVVSDVIIKYKDSVTKKTRSLSLQEDVISIETTCEDHFWYRTETYVVTRNDGSKVTLRSKFKLHK